MPDPDGGAPQQKTRRVSETVARAKVTLDWATEWLKSTLEYELKYRAVNDYDAHGWAPIHVAAPSLERRAQLCTIRFCTHVGGWCRASSRESMVLGCSGELVMMPFGSKFNYGTDSFTNLTLPTMAEFRNSGGAVS